MKKNLCLIACLTALLVGCDQAENSNLSGTAKLMNGHRCDFQVFEEDGRLVPADPDNGEVLGLFERWPDGAIQLTTAEGFTPIVTDCLKQKGFEARLSSIEPYWVPDRAQKP
jgi:hypothetical protein